MIRGLEPLCWEDRLGELGPVSLEKGRLWEDFRVVFHYLKGMARELERGFLRRHGVIGQRVIALDRKRADLDEILGRNSSPWGWWNTGPGCLEKLWLPPPWQCLRPGRTGLWASWAGGSVPCPWQGGWNGMICKVPSYPNGSRILGFYESR